MDRNCEQDNAMRWSLGKFRNVTHYIAGWIPILMMADWQAMENCPISPGDLEDNAEALEFYEVSEAGLYLEQAGGRIIMGPVGGELIWCRYASGQALWMDRIVVDAYRIAVEAGTT